MVRISLRWTTLIVCLVSTIATTQEIKVTVNTEQHAQVINEKFLSLMIDPTVLLSGTNLRSTRILNMAKSLAPAYLKLAGPDSNFYQFQITHKQQKDKSIITEAQWIDINHFAEETGLELIVALNMMGRTNDSWDSSSSMELISFSNKMGYNISWQLGFELQELHSNISASQMGKDVAKLRLILDAMPQYEDSQLLGPDITRSGTEEDINFLKQYFHEAEPVLSGITWHPDLNEEHYKLENMDYITKWLTFNRESLSEKLGGIMSKKPLWIGEKSRRYSKGVFMDALLWAHRLGSMARMGVHVVMRQPDLRVLVEATPEYWVSLLYKTLVGNVVLDAKENYGNFTDLHMYCHCHSQKSGAITFFGINHLNTEMNVTIELSSGEKQGTHVVHEYVLTSVGNALNPLQSRKIKMNGQTLNLGMNGDVPILSPKIQDLTSTTAITVPPYSVGFWILPDIKVKPCLTMPNSINTEEIKENVLYDTEANLESTSHVSVKHEQFISNLKESQQINKSENVSRESNLTMQMNKPSTSTTSNIDSRMNLTETITMKDKMNSKETSGNLDHNETKLSNNEGNSKKEANRRQKRYLKENGGYMIPGLEPDIFQYAALKNPLNKFQRLNYINKYPKFNLLNRHDRNFQRSLRNMHDQERSEPIEAISFEEDEYSFPSADIYINKDEILSGEHPRRYDYVDGDESLYEEAVAIDPAYYHAPGEYFEHFQISKANADNRFAGYGGELWEAETYARLKHEKDEEDKNSEGNEEDTIIKEESPTEEDDKKGKAAAREMLTKYYAKPYEKSIKENSKEDDSAISKLEREKRRNKDNDTEHVKILASKEKETENASKSLRSKNEDMDALAIQSGNEKNKKDKIKKQIESNFDTYTFRLRKPYNEKVKRKQENITKHKNQYEIERQKQLHEKNYYDEVAEEQETSKSEKENMVNEKIRRVKENNEDGSNISKEKHNRNKDNELIVEGTTERTHDSNKDSSTQEEYPEKSDYTEDKEELSVKKHKFINDSFKRKFLRRLPQNPYESDEEMLKEDWKPTLYRKFPRPEFDSEDTLNTEEVYEDLRRGRALRLNNAAKRKISQNLRSSRRLQRDLSRQFMEGDVNKNNFINDNIEEISDNDSEMAKETKSNLSPNNMLINKYDSMYSDEDSESYWRFQNYGSLEYLNELPVDSTAVKFNGHRKRESGKDYSSKVVHSTVEEMGIVKGFNREKLKKKSVKEEPSSGITERNAPLSATSKTNNNHEQIRDSANKLDEKLQDSIELKSVSEIHGIIAIPNYTPHENITKENIVELSNLKTEANISGINSHELTVKATVIGANMKQLDDTTNDSEREAEVLEMDNINNDKVGILDAELVKDKPEIIESKVRMPKAISHNMQIQQISDNMETSPLHIVEDIVGNALEIGAIASNKHSDIHTNPHDSDTTARIIDKAMSIGSLGLDVGSGLVVPEENNLMKLNTQASLNTARKIMGNALSLGTLKQNSEWPRRSLQQNEQGIKTQYGRFGPKPIHLTDTDEKPIKKIPNINIIRENVNSLINSIGKKGRNANGIVQETNTYQVKRLKDKIDDIIDSNTFEKDEKNVESLKEENMIEEAQPEQSIKDEINDEQAIDTGDDDTLSPVILDVSESKLNKFEDFGTNEISDEENYSEPLVRNAKDVKHITAQNFNVDLDDLRQHAENHLSLLNNRHLLKAELDKKRIETLHALDAHKAKLREDLIKRNAELLKLKAALHIRTRRETDLLPISDDSFNGDESSENNGSMNSKTIGEEEDHEYDYNSKARDQDTERDNLMRSTGDSQIQDIHLAPMKLESDLSQADFSPENYFPYSSSLQTEQPVSESSGFFNIESIPLFMLFNIASMPVNMLPENNKMQEEDAIQHKANVNGFFNNLHFDTKEENNINNNNNEQMKEDGSTEGSYIEVKERSLPLFIPRITIPHDPILQQFYGIPAEENDIKYFLDSEDDETESDDYNIRELTRVQRYIVPPAMSSETDNLAGSPLSVINNDFMDNVLEVTEPQAVIEDITDVNLVLPETKLEHGMENINDTADNKKSHEEIQSAINLSDDTSKEDIKEKTYGSSNLDSINDTEGFQEFGFYNLISKRFKRSLDDNGKFSHNLLPFTTETLTDDKWAANNINEKYKSTRFLAFKDLTNSEMPILDTSHRQDEIFNLEPFLEKTHNTYNDPVFETDFDLLADENKKQNNLFHTENDVKVNETQHGSSEINNAYNRYERRTNKGENPVNLETNQINKYYREDSNMYNNEESTSLDSTEENTVKIKEIPYKKRKLIPKKYYPPLFIKLGIDDNKKYVAGLDNEAHNVKLDFKMSNDLPFTFIGNKASENMLSLSLNEFSNKDKTNEHLLNETSQTVLQIPNNIYASPNITTYGNSSSELLSPKNRHKNSPTNYINDVEGAFVNNNVNNFLRNMRNVAYLENRPVSQSMKEETNDYTQNMTNDSDDDNTTDVHLESSEQELTPLTPTTELTPTMTARIHKIIRSISDHIVGFFHKIAPWNYLNHR